MEVIKYTDKCIIRGMTNVKTFFFYKEKEIKSSISVGRSPRESYFSLILQTLLHKETTPEEFKR